jgi:uncharacterized protein (DUF433 family)
MSISAPERVDLSKYIDHRHFEGRPHVRGRRLTVAMVAYSARGNGWTVAETARQFGLNEAQALAALLYYEEYRALIDQQEAEERAQFEAIFDQHG